MTALPIQLPPLAQPRSGPGRGSVAAAIDERIDEKTDRPTETQFDSLLDRSRTTNRSARGWPDRRAQADTPGGRTGTEAANQAGAAAVTYRVLASEAGRADGGQSTALATAGSIQAAVAKMRSDAPASRTPRPTGNVSAAESADKPQTAPASSGTPGAGSLPTDAIATTAPTDARGLTGPTTARTYAQTSPPPVAVASPPAATTDLAAAAAISIGSAGQVALVMDALPTPLASLVGEPAIVPAEATPSATVSGDAVSKGPANGIRTQVLQQVMMQTVGKADASRLTLQLEPEHLGRITVELRADGNRLTVVFDAQSAVAQEALREGGKELAASLLDRGDGRWSQVEVKLAERESEQRQHDADRRREDARQQRQPGENNDPGGRSNRRRWGG